MACYGDSFTFTQEYYWHCVAPQREDCRSCNAYIDSDDDDAKCHDLSVAFSP
jgi:hypothetical protein